MVEEGGCGRVAAAAAAGEEIGMSGFSRIARKYTRGNVLFLNHDHDSEDPTGSLRSQ